MTDIIIPSGISELDTIQLKTGDRLIGEGSRNSVIKYNGNDYAFKAEIVKEYVIPEHVEDFIFDFDEPLEYRDSYYEDANYQHKFYMVYQNSTGSRREEIKIDPIKL